MSVAVDYLLCGVVHILPDVLHCCHAFIVVFSVKTFTLISELRMVEVKPRCRVTVYQFCVV
jgi:hypothetical protein